MENQKVETLLASWLNTGHEVSSASNLPKHPEFIYRKSGEWKGWNLFLKQSKGSASYDKHIQQDLLEDQAWQLYMNRFHS